MLGNSAILPSFFLCYSIQPARSQKIAHSSSFDILFQWLTIPYVATLQHAAQYRPSRNGGQFFLPGYWLHYSQIKKQLLFFFQSSNVTLLHLSITRPNPIFSIQFIPPRPLVTEANLPNQSHQKSHWINSINRVICHIQK